MSVTPHPWNDLEQRFLRFTITLKELLESVAIRIDEENVPAEVVDTVSNIVIGAKEYLITCENEIAEAMEQKIAHDYKSGAYQQITGTLFIDDDWTVQLPKYLVETLDWRPGDRLEWKVEDNGHVMVRKVDG
jgi:hypothetical protein